MDVLLDRIDQIAVAGLSLHLLFLVRALSVSVSSNLWSIYLKIIGDYFLRFFSLQNCLLYLLAILLFI